MKATRSVTLRLLYDTTADELVRALQDVPGEARIRVSHSVGDRPWNATEYRIRIEWEETP
jgi:hypothetical protein